MRRILAICALLCMPFSAFAGPKEEGQAVFQQFLSDFTAANADAVASHFTPEAIFWGTVARNLITTPDGIKQYFATTFGSPPRAAGVAKASAVGSPSVMVLSDDVVVVSGIWQLERVVDGKAAITEFRNSATMVKRGDRWLIGSFHNSLRPAAP